MISRRILVWSGLALSGLVAMALRSKAAGGVGDAAGETPVPMRVTLCDLGRDPDEYKGRFVQARVVIRGGKELVVDEAGPVDPCASYILVLLAFPDDVKPSVDFRVLEDASLEKLRRALRTYSYIEATIEARFDSVIARRHGKVERTGKGFGRKHLADGRLVLRRVSDVVVWPLPRK